MSFVGMDLEAARLMARSLTLASEQLTQIRVSADRLLLGMWMPWSGRDADSFTREWQEVHRSKINLAITCLEDLARAVNSNADEQEAASSADLGTPKSGLGIGPQEDEYLTPKEETLIWLNSLPRTRESWRDSLEKSNPHYHDFTQDLSTFCGKLGLLESIGEYRMNCGYSAIAYDMRRRGYDVSARPDLNGDSPENLAKAYVDQGTGESREWIQAKTESKVVDLMEEFGTGSRAIVIVAWKGNTGGHAFIAENLDGEVRFIDPQKGSVSAREYFKRIQPGEVEILRIDDQDPRMNPMSYLMVTPDHD